MSKLFSRLNLQFTFIKNIYISIDFFLLWKFWPIFVKTVETGIDPRLQGVAKGLYWPKISEGLIRDESLHGEGTTDVCTTLESSWKQQQENTLKNMYADWF